MSKSAQERLNELAADTMAGKYDSPQSAAEALNNDEALMDFAKAAGKEIWAVIDQKTFSIKEVGVGSSSSARGVYLGSYRGGDSVWHTHPGGGDIHSGDWNSAYLEGGRGSAAYIFASGDRLTGYNMRAHSLPFSSAGGYRNYSGSWRFEKLIFSNGSWSSINGSFSK
ncbi:hypothetical protein FKG94_12850 [Exilibacterium tricleocarpae]|uniref:Uncharacterized protein n=1 Tax=Exilibacterium tricleocarpae TaxID=2591008 RepID=A0A545TNU9_9GAMM|nr:hypothetical protein [Exilibacterium tricleocarpae]TQV78899.1 hypothetical protein FKG94_12850 [Exilibacterium tricleocarpae]